MNKGQWTVDRCRGQWSMRDWGQGYVVVYIYSKYI